MKVEVTGTVAHRWTAVLDVPDDVAERWFARFDDGDLGFDSEIFEDWIDPGSHYDEGTNVELDELRLMDGKEDTDD